VVENVVMERLRVRPNVQQLVRRESTIWRRCDVADVVASGSAGSESEFLHAREDFDDIARLELANLQIAARGDVRVAAAEIVREIGEAVKLRGRQITARNPRSQHEAVLSRRDVEQAEILESVSVLGIGKLVFVRVLEQSIPSIEWILVVLPAFLFAEIRKRSAVKRGFTNGFGEIRRVGSGR
jgi:hypothetical protein